MASTESTTNLSNVLASLSETLVEFRAESAEIESRFFELVDEVGPLTNTAPAETTARDSSAIESIAVEHLENLDRSMAEQREELTGKQDQLSDDVGQLRELVDQQVQLFAAWLESTAKIKPGNSSRKGKMVRTGAS